MGGFWGVVRRKRRKAGNTKEWGGRGLCVRRTKVECRCGGGCARNQDGMAAKRGGETMSW